MFLKEAYHVEPGKAVLALESLAEMCISPKYRDRFTVRGYTNRAPDDLYKTLVPFKENELHDYYPFVSGFVGHHFAELLKGADAVLSHINGGLDNSGVGVRTRFDIRNLLGGGLDGMLEADQKLKQFGLLNQGDDGMWHFSLDYRNRRTKGPEYRNLNCDNLMVLTVGDNGDDRRSTQLNFRDFCQNTFGNAINPFIARKLI